MPLTETQKEYLRSKLDLVADLPSLYQGVGSWDPTLARCKPGSARRAEAEKASSEMLAEARAKQAAALAYLAETGADQETLDSLAEAEACFREVGRLNQRLRLRRSKPGSKRWQELDRRHTEVTNRGFAARDKYNLWVMIQAARQP